MLQVTLQASRNLIPASAAAQVVYLLLQIGPPPEFVIARMPLNICLVVDRSTSMQGERLEQVKQAASILVEGLASNDIVSVISYSDRAEITVPAAHVRNTTPVIARIRGITPSGGTEIYQGLQAGVTEMRKVDLTSHLNYLLLLTDGHTYGDEDACLLLARNIVSEKIGISALGIGSEWNDRFLDKLVEPSGGQTGFIESPSQIIDFLQQRIRNLGAVHAHNVVLSTMPFPNSVQLQYAIKLSPFAQPLATDRGAINLGIVEGHTPTTILLSFIVSPLEPGDTLRIPFRFTAEFPAEEEAEQTVECSFEAPVAEDPELIDPPKALVQAVQMANLYRMNEKAQREAEKGDLEIAVTRMRSLTARMMEAGHQQLATQAHLEMERLQMKGNLSQEGQKRLKYGTRALLTQTIGVDESGGT
jgi:Ca-activated chloride channel family protein